MPSVYQSVFVLVFQEYFKLFIFSFPKPNRVICLFLWVAFILISHVSYVSMAICIFILGIAYYWNWDRISVHLLWKNILSKVMRAFKLLLQSMLLFNRTLFTNNPVHLTGNRGKIKWSCNVPKLRQCFF